MLDKNLSPDLIKNMNSTELKQLSDEIRTFLIDLAKEKEIHLSSNLGIVELALGLACNFDFKKDKIIYDTGHQTYVHKIITGRIDDLKNLKTDKSNGGLQIYNQTEFDHYGGGHSGNALSIGAGYSLFIHDGFCICVIGDSALNTGLAFEALNYIGEYKNRVIVILNDNDMSISASTGALKNHLKKIKKRNNFFTNLGFKYFGPYNGHDFNVINKILNKAKNSINKKPIIIHFKTQKGKGLYEAENDKIGRYHSYSFNQKEDIKFGDVACENLKNKIDHDPNLWILNPAMNWGAGFADLITHPRYIDLGIAEEHCLSLASALALKQKKVFVSYYSTFLQRAYDQLIHDVARFNLNLTILLDRADIATNEGDSHHGIFDVGYLKTIPNVEIYSPRNYEQLNVLIDYCYSKNSGINVIRYPTRVFKSNAVTSFGFKYKEYEWLINKKHDVLVISYGPYSDLINNEFIKKDVKSDLVNLIKITNLNHKFLNQISHQYKKIIVYERIFGTCGVYNELTTYVNSKLSQTKIINMSYKDFVGIGTLECIDTKNKMSLRHLIEEINK